MNYILWKKKACTYIKNKGVGGYLLVSFDAPISFSGHDCEQLLPFHPYNPPCPPLFQLTTFCMKITTNVKFCALAITNLKDCLTDLIL